MTEALPLDTVDTFGITTWINRIQHRSPMQTEKSQPDGKRIMPETRFSEFPALSVDPRVKISRSASETDNGLFS